MDPAEVNSERDGRARGEPARPRPWASSRQRAQEATLGRIRPWVDWFGAGRVAGVAITVAATVIGGWWLLRPAGAPTEAMLPYASVPASAPAETVTASTATMVPATVVVHVAGAVVSPGVYELGGGARVVGAVEAAGGPADGADLSALNLAAVIADGQRVYVPLVGETPPVVAVAGEPATSGSGPPGPIDINEATPGELDALPGIGPATASAIVDHREQHGPFAGVDDLEAVRGIGPAKLDALRDLVTT